MGLLNLIAVRAGALRPIKRPNILAVGLTNGQSNRTGIGQQAKNGQRQQLQG